MFKYVKFEKVETEYTVLEFRGGSEDVKVNSFDVNVVSIESDDESAIDALIAEQGTFVQVQEVTAAEFKELVKDSAQINRMRDVVKAEIAKRYSLGDELGMMKRDVADAKRIEYEAYVQQCINIGDSLKAEVGY